MKRPPHRAHGLSRAGTGLPGHSRWDIGAIAAAVALYGAFLWRGRYVLDGRRIFGLFDDALISLRYAQHLAAGEGFLFNLGDPPVEGVTNLLWTLLLVPVHWLGLEVGTRSLVVGILGSALLVAAALVAARAAPLLFRTAPAEVLRPTVLVGCLLFYPTAFWTLRGFEVGLLALVCSLLLWGSASTETGGWKRGAVLLGATAVGLLARQDALVMVLVVAGWLLFQPLPQSRRLGLGMLVVALASLAALTGWRLNTFGELLPNTAYLKLEHIPLSSRLSRGLLMLASTSARDLLPYLLLAVLGLPALGMAALRSGPGLAAAICLGQAGYSVWVGGDVWERLGIANRFLSVVSPAFVVCVAIGAVRLLHEDSASLRSVLGRRLGGLAAGLGVLFLLLSPVPLMTARALPDAVVHLPYGRWVLAVGFILGGTACLVFAGLARRRAAEVLLRLRARLLTETAPAGRQTWLAVMLVLLPASPDWTGWALRNFEMYEWDYNAAKSALHVAQATPPTASVAATAIGALGYFGNRRVVDLLGKIDPVIARGYPRTPKFVPGHDKWNLQHSIGKLKPDYVVDLPMGVSPEDVAWFRAQPYAIDQSGMHHRTAP